MMMHRYTGAQWRTAEQRFSSLYCHYTAFCSLSSRNSHNGFLLIPVALDPSDQTHSQRGGTGAGRDGDESRPTNMTLIARPSRTSCPPLGDDDKHLHHAQHILGQQDADREPGVRHSMNVYSRTTRPTIVIFMMDPVTEMHSTLMTGSGRRAVTTSYNPPNGPSQRIALCVDLSVLLILF